MMRIYRAALKYPLWIISILSLVIFWHALRTFFVGDDFWWLYSGKNVMATWSGWVNAFTQVNGAGMYRPLTQNVFFGLAWRLFGANPLGYHLVLMAFFIISGVVLFRFLRVATQSSPSATAGTALWMFSSTHFEGLNWSAAFSETGVMLFAMLVLLSGARSRFRMATFWFIICLLSNETTIVLPGIISCYEWILRRTTFKQAIRNTLPLWIIAFIYLILRFTVIGTHMQGAFSIVFPGPVWVSLFVHSMLVAVGYSGPFLNVLHSSSTWSTLLFLAFIALWGSVLAVWIVTLIKRVHYGEAARCAIFGVLSFVCGLLILLPFGKDFADYNLALPLVGVSMLLASSIQFLSSRMKLQRATAILIIATLWCVNFCTISGPGGLNDTDGVAVLSKVSKSVFIQLQAIELRHPGPLQVGISSPDALWITSGNWEADLIAPHSTVVYGDTYTDSPIRFVYNSSTHSMTLVNH